ncbi:MAG: ABC transporter ATP-binding protein [Firmicutes bacterium]|nr:ABC transporter ATP-binding protein [Bacillota bacterium]
MKAEQIICKNAVLGYEKTPVTQNLNFSVCEGDYLCIVGENGSGKSTLVKTLLGLNPPICGKITMGGGVKPTLIGYLPQQTVVQKDFPASVWEIVLSGCLSKSGLRPFYSKTEKETARKNIERLGIADLSDKCYRDLSGGQQQRVLLARALCAADKLLLLDEPVTGLDPVATADMYALIETLNKNGITIIMISHDTGAAVKYASHILHMADEVFFGTKEEYLKSRQGKLFLDTKGGE